MEAAYWHDKWATGDVKFHQEEFNPLMVKHFGALGLAQGARVFVPLCGKTRDIAWLLGQGFVVVGAELSETAVKDLFADLGLTPEVSDIGALRLYASAGIAVYAGDIFALSADELGPVDAVFDRAALVALQDEMRAAYVAHMTVLVGTTPRFVITYTYDQATMPGPPFSISSAMMDAYFATDLTLTVLEELDVPPPGLKGQVPATETVWMVG